MADAAARFSEPDVICLGDYNADNPRYYDEALLDDVFPDSECVIVIPDTADTTVAGNPYTYDRIVLTTAAREDFTGRWGVDEFDKTESFAAFGIEARQVSDHYPVWAEFYVDRDSDATPQEPE